MEAERTTDSKRTSTPGTPRRKGQVVSESATTSAAKTTRQTSAEDLAKEKLQEFESAELERFEDAKAKTSRKIEKSLDATQLYRNEIGSSPLLTADEEKHYARLALKGDEAGRRRMIER